MWNGPSGPCSPAATININRNFGSSNTLTADAFVGAEGKTLTDGDVSLSAYGFPSSRSVIGLSEILTKGASLGVRVTPGTSNSSMSVYCAIVCYVQQGG